MSKSIVHTREKILDKALEMFNERGIEYVGLRELAAVLHMRVSNITYYFPTKDDLVHELSLGLSKKNSGEIVERDQLTLLTFLQTLQRVYRHHVEYRCLLLSVVHLLRQNRHMAAAYKKTQNMRSATLHSNIRVLADAGYLALPEKESEEFLVTTLSLISRFWISEASVSQRNKSFEEQVQHYLIMVTRLLQPYATAKGKKEMEQFLKQL